MALLLTGVGALGTVVFSCLSMKGGIQLGKTDCAIGGVLGMVIVFLWVGNRVLSLWPRLFTEMTEALFFGFVGYIYFRNWRRHRLGGPK